MENANFRKWVTSATFNISLTSSQIKVIRSVSRKENAAIDSIHPMVASSVIRRGLVTSDGVDLYLTKAGALVAGLIEEAGIAEQDLGMPTIYDKREKKPYQPHPAVALKLAGMSNRDIAAKLKIDHQSVRKYMSRHNKRIKQ